MDKLFIKRVQSEPVLDEFNCGNGSINGQIRDGYYISLLKQAYAYEVCIGKQVIGYYRISITPLIYEDESYYIESVGNGYSAIKLDYLAIDREYQDRGNGTAVLKYITKQTEKYSESLPIRFLTLDALREKVSWYEKRGFKLYNEQDLVESSETIAMYMDFCDIYKVKDYSDSFGVE